MVIVLDIIQSGVKWLLYSPVRFVLILVVAGVLALGFVIANRANDANEPGAQAAPESTEATNTATEGDTTPEPSGSEAAVPEEDEGDAEALAVKFVNAWAAKPDSAEKWFKGVEPLSTEELNGRLRWVEPRQSDKYTVEKDAKARKADPFDSGTTAYGVPTDKGLVYVEIVKDTTGTLKVNNVYTGVGGE